MIKKLRQPITYFETGRPGICLGSNGSRPSRNQLFLKMLFVVCRHAFDVWQWMVKRGYYPVEAAPQENTQTMTQMFQVVESPVGTMPLQ
jgi:hypothetical protein